MSFTSEWGDQYLSLAVPLTIIYGTVFTARSIGTAKLTPDEVPEPVKVNVDFLSQPKPHTVEVGKIGYSLPLRVKVAVLTPIT